jgi:transposase, IS5 family
MQSKATLLGQWHSLSDPALEAAPRVRIGSVVFCGLDLASDMPDGATLCRFRNRLVATGKLPMLLSAVNAQLQANGLMAKAPQGAALDATLVRSAARPRGGTALETDSQGQPVSHEDGGQPGVVAVEPQSADTDAAWLNTGKKPHYGYRRHVAVDPEDGYARGVHGTPPTRAKPATLKKPWKRRTSRPPGYWRTRAMLALPIVITPNNASKNPASCTRRHVTDR